MLSVRTTRSPIGPLGLASLGFVSLGLPEGLLGVAWPSIRESFGLGLDALGALLATFASGYFVASALSGRVLGRFGVGSVLSVSCAVTGVSLLGYSAAPTWPAMVALGAVLGAGAGTIDAGLNTYAAVQHGPRVLNWMHAAFGLGAAVGPLVMTAILQAGLPWTVGYLLVAAAQLCLSLGYALLREQLGSPATGDSAGASPPIRTFLGNPLVWISVALFFVYVGLEATAGQWSFTLLTQSREVPATLAGLLISGYWACLTIGRLLFGLVVNHVSPTNLLRVCMLIAILAAGLLWQGGSGSYALLVLGLVFAPIFPVLIAETPGRLGLGQTPDAIGLQVAAAVVGGAAIPAVVGMLAARVGLEVVGAVLVVSAVLQLGLYELLVRRAFAPRRSARSQTDAAASSRPRA